MRISDMIRELEDIQRDLGDLQVVHLRPCQEDGKYVHHPDILAGSQVTGELKDHYQASHVCVIGIVSDGHRITGRRFRGKLKAVPTH